MATQFLASFVDIEIFNLFSVPDWALWAGVGLVVALIIIFIAIGFFKELKK